MLYLCIDLLTNLLIYMKNTTSLRSRISALDNGASITISVDDYGLGTARQYAYELGVTLRRKYRLHLDRQERVFIITRTA